MPASHSSAGSGRLLTFLCLTFLLCGCGGEEADREGTTSAPPPYPTGLSAASTPRQAAEVLIEALDQKNGQVLEGLVAARHEAEQVDAIYRRHGRRHQTSLIEAARLAASGWSATYAWFEPGTTKVTGELIQGETTVVEARGRNPSTGRPRLLVIEMIREDGVWKVKAGLESSEL